MSFLIPAIVVYALLNYKEPESNCSFNYVNLSQLNVIRLPLQNIKYCSFLPRHKCLLQPLIIAKGVDF